jgi:two-component system, OmpR family, phosphate regulon sensor histidine kinase PhoR
MKTLNAKIIALYAALLAAAVSGVAEILSRAGSGLVGFSPVMAVSVILVFVSVYLLIYFLLTSFIYNKINPIYTTISNLKESVTKVQKEPDRNDLIEDLNREVEDWATSKTREIDQLKEMELYRKEFLDNVSHEIKTPLFNVQGYIIKLLNGDLEDPSVNRIYLERAQKSLNRLINIVSDLDIISGLDSGEVKLHFENFDIVQLVRDVFELQEMRAQAMGISLKLKNNREASIMVHADRRRIQEILVNLVVNSIKYGNQDGCTSVGFTDMEDNILVEVSDNGLGIPADDLPRVFERFYRVDKSRSRNQGGTGLGLAIVKHVVEAHNQAIRVKSKEDKGTTFSFTLRKGRQE